MSVSISAHNGAGTSNPITVLSPYATERQARSIVHDLIGGGIAVSLIEPRPRAGTIAYLFDNEDDAAACLALHAAPTSFTLTVSDSTSTGMEYVLQGVASLALDPQSITAWIVTVGYQQI